MQMAMGSEGTLGVITEVIMRLRPVPAARVYGSVVFGNFGQGIRAMREIARVGCQPASIRLMDPIQFQFGQALKPESENPVKDELFGAMQKAYLFNYKGLNPEKMCAATLVFEGSPSDIRQQERQLYDICSKYGGIKGGPDNGLRGYFLTYVIA